MRKTILLLGFLLLIPIVLADTQVSVDVNSTEAIDGYFNLESPDNDVWINGINYQRYVDNKVYGATRGGMTRSEVAKTLVRSWETFKGTTAFPSNYDMTIASVYYRIIDYSVKYIYDVWILPITIKQNAIIQTLEDTGLTEHFCKNLASEYFKVYDDNRFVCENNNKTYYKGMDFAISVKAVQ